MTLACARDSSRGGRATTLMNLGLPGLMSAVIRGNLALAQTPRYVQRRSSYGVP